MPQKKLYNLLVGLFPAIYLIHNAEEWWFFDSKVAAILKVIPANIKALIHYDSKVISIVFGVAIIVATVIPIVVALIIWGKMTSLNVKVLLVIAFVTLVNAISHILSSISLGFLSPGFVTGIALCVPYSAAVIHFIRRHFRYTMKLYLLLGLSSAGIFVAAIALSWLLGILVVSMFQ